MHVKMEDMLELLQRVAYRTQSTIRIGTWSSGPDHPLHISIPELIICSGSQKNIKM